MGPHASFLDGVQSIFDSVQHHYHELDFESTVFVKKEVVENELANKYGPRTLSDASGGNRADHNSALVTDTGGRVKILSKSGSKGDKTEPLSCIVVTEDLYPDHSRPHLLGMLQSSTRENTKAVSSSDGNTL